MNTQEDLFSKILGNRKLLIIVGAVILVVIILSLVLTSGKTDTAREVALLANKITLLGNFAEKSQNELDDSALKSSNATVSVTLAGVATSLNTLTGNIKIDGDPAKIQSAHIAELNESLTSAKVINNYTNEYKEIITEELSAIASETRALGKNTSAKVKASLEANASKIDAVSKF